MTKIIPERSDVPAEHRWNLASLFSTDSEWEKELVVFNTMIHDAEKGKISLGTDRQAFLKGILVGVAIRKAAEETEIADPTEEERRIDLELEKLGFSQIDKS